MSQAHGNATLTGVWDLEEVTPLFNVPAAVAFGDMKSEASKILPGEILSGQLKSKNASLKEANTDLKAEMTEFHVVQQGRRSFLSTSRRKISAQRSFYQPHFKEGATIVPRNFWFVEFKVIPGLGMDISQPVVATDPRAEAEAKQPYKGIHFDAAIEAEFLYATLLSTDLLPFGHFDFRPIVLPLIQDPQGYRLFTSIQARAKGYLKLPEWLEHAQEVWERKRQEKAKRMNILQRLDLQRGLTDQDPKAKYIVIYPKSATFLCAAVVRSRPITFRVGPHRVGAGGFLADYVTYFLETSDIEEARYLTAVLNSPAIDALIKPMQARGLWGPRDITKKVWELPIPEFNQKNKTHVRLAEIAEACAEKVKDMVPDLKKLFEDVRGPHAIGRARTAVRQALKDELAEIDSLVKEILK